ncbi:MAG: Gfo/Idh/MocA family oxidoreductase [Arachnia sp.]
MSEDDGVVRVALIGAGGRGQGYAYWIQRHPERARLVAVAEPDEHRAGLIRAGHPDVRRYPSWTDLLADDTLAFDMAIVATQDRFHREPVLALAPRGVAVLVEKPIAPTLEECREIVAAVEDAGIVFGVCHVLRYTGYTDAVKEIVDSGLLGTIVSIEHLEPVGWWHMAHSYVRGPWRREDESSPMLLAKSCHDLDWISYVTGIEYDQLASFGRLSHFTPDHAPVGSAARCVDCAAEPDCPYSAPKLYLPVVRERGAAWPVSAITDGDTEDDVWAALRTGPYGRCVYGCDNDVVDNQVVAFTGRGGETGTFTMMAFTEQTHRKSRIFGTHGRLECDGDTLDVLDFRTGERRVIDVGATGSNAASGHGGGDDGLMDAFVAAVAAGDPSLVRSGPRDSLASHAAVFAAEQARREERVVRAPTR